MNIKFLKSFDLFKVSAIICIICSISLIILLTFGQSNQFIERNRLDDYCRVAIIDGPVGLESIASVKSADYPILIISKNDIFGVSFDARVCYMIGDEGYLLDIPINLISLSNTKDKVSNVDFEFSGVCDDTKSIQYNIDHHLTKLKIELPMSSFKESHPILQ